ncbi:GNAT family N-acetyltransferase [Cyclobacterium xiamenense]|uniref:GNAT family N-acetyltransferase n=1 Tax=Cyclobacterium xiamenense TaxID=1297121 RepID=UPI0035CEC927
MKDKYIFKSTRLGFRNWRSEDLEEFAEMNNDVEIMEHFPKPLSRTESEKLMKRMQVHYDKNGYTYFATERLDTGELIGFIGLAYQEYKAEFTPAIDIGWRLKKDAWGTGYATEGARRCLTFGFNELGIKKIVSTCTIGNKKSENVMKKIGMIKKGEFNHPELTEFPDFEKCIWYEIENK